MPAPEFCWNHDEDEAVRLVHVWPNVLACPGCSVRIIDDELVGELEEPLELLARQPMLSAA